MCYAGHYYLSYWPSPIPINPNPKRNIPIHKKYKNIRNFVSSGGEAEKYVTLNNRKTFITMLPALITLDHKQPATPLETDNSITEGFVNLGMKPKCSNMGYEVALVERQRGT